MKGNLFEQPGNASRAGEHTDELLSHPGIRVERIISTGQASPPGFWYEQNEAEWVVLLSGAAELEFEDAPEPHKMAPGDWISIAAGQRHRVLWTDPSQPSVWLAIHYR